MNTIQKEPNMHAAVVLSNGSPIAGTADIDVLYPQYSVTKSLVSLIIGMLCSECRLSLHKQIGSLLPVRPESLLSRITLGQLLTMQSGIREKLLFADRRTCPDYLAACAVQEVGEPVFQYNNACAYLAGRIAEEAADEALDTMIVNRIFRPLGIERYEFEYDPQGHCFGASGLMLSTADLAKLGQSVLDAELYPKQWIWEATRPHAVSNDGRGYGYFFWTDGGSFYMSGKWGQKCVIFPERHAVVAVNSEMRDEDHTLGYACSLLSMLEG